MEERKIEFFMTGDHKLWMRDGEGDTRRLLSGEVATVEWLRERMKTVYPDVYATLARHYERYKGNRLNYDYKIVTRFVRCNMGEDDTYRFDIEGDKMNLEQTRCPLKGSGDCPFENVVCNPKPTGLTEKETEVLRLRARGHTVKGIGLLLGKSSETVKHQLWRIKERFGLKSTNEVLLSAYLYNWV